MTDRGGPDGPQELYWLSRSVERLAAIVERMSTRLDKIERDQAIEDAMKRDSSKRISRREKWLYGIAIGTGTWFLRDVLTPVLERMRHH